MPVVAVIGGIASAAAGVTAFAAATTTLGTIAAGLSIVGGVASALGGLTGNKKLMKFGMIAGLGGAALGGLNSLMNTGADAASKGSMASAGTNAVKDANSLTQGTFAPGSEGMLSNLGPAPGMENVVGTPNTFAPNLNLAKPSPVAAPVAPPPPIAGSPLGPMADAGGQAANLGYRGEVTMQGVGGVGSVAPPAPTGLWAKATGLLGNPELMKVGMGALQGMSQSKAQQAQLEYAEELRAKERQRYNDSINGVRRAY